MKARTFDPLKSFRWRDSSGRWHEVPAARCEWFLRCENEATHLEPHPMLESVPCCDRCAELARAGS